MQWSIVMYIYIFFREAPLPDTFKASSTKFTTVARPKSDRSLKKSHEKFLINGIFLLQITSESLNDDLKEKKVLMEIKWLIFTDTLR